MTPQDILERIASSTGVDVATITGTSRRHPHARARHAAALALHRAGLSYSAIGRVLGSQEHTSAIYACKRALAREAADPAFAAVVAGLSCPACPACRQPATHITSAPVVWCCGVSTSHAGSREEKQHERRDPGRPVPAAAGPRYLDMQAAKSSTNKETTSHHK